MKAKIVPILTLLCLHFSPLFSQTPKYIIGAAEYNCYILNTATHKAYDVAGGVPTLIAGQPAAVTAVEGSLHHGCLLDDKGNMYCWGNNVNGQIGNGTTSIKNVPMYKVAVDSLGNPFNNIVQIMPGGSSYGYSTAALKGDGTVWIWGATGGGNRGNGYFGGTNTRPVQVNFPAGVVIKKIQIDVVGIALDANGNVWTWGGNAGYAAPYVLAQNTYTPDCNTPHMLSLPSKAVDITGGNLWNYALLANGQLYGWGFYSAYLGIGNSGFKAEAAAKIVPVLLNSELGLPLPIRQIKVSSAGTYVLLTDSTLWAWGDNACGSIGNGTMMNWASYTVSPSPSGGTPAPYNWDWGPGELMQQKPVQIAKGLHSFTDIWTSGADTYYCYVEDVHGQLYSWGRNKGSVLGNGVNASDIGALAAIYPNSWDVPWITAVDPFSLKKVIPASSPFCVLSPTGSPCNSILNKILSLAPPTVSAGPNQNITTTTTTLSGTAKASGSGNVIAYLWTQVSGPNTPLIVINTGATAQLQGLVSGTYVFQLKATDNSWRSSTSTVTIVVNAPGNKPPKAATKGKITITLPVNSATLDGSPSTDPDGTIATYAWTQVSGPSTAGVAAPSGASTSVTGLVQGTYAFFLTVTDNQGSTGTVYDTVVVNPAVVKTPPTVGAGITQTIKLPVSSVTLTGTATGNGGAAISSTSWTQASGPNTAVIASASSLSTGVSGLVAGTYTFKLSATDNNTLTSTSTVTVIVTAANVAPTVSAGSTQAIQLPTSSVTLTGTATGNGGATISSTSWTQVSGPNTAVLAAASSLSTGVSGLVAGTYTFKLSATDNNTLSGTSTVTVTVTAANVAPTVNAGGKQTIQLPTSSVTLTGTATGNGGATISSTSWTQVSGPNTAVLVSASSVSTGVSGLVAGTYTFKLSATDNNGLSGSATVTVIVNGASNVAPTVSAGSPQSIQLPVNSVTLTGTATGNGGATIATTNWMQTSGPGGSVIASASSLNTGVSGLVAGTYVFELIATDNNGLSDAQTVTITVKAANVAPTVNAGSTKTIQLPVSSVTLTGTATGNGGATISSDDWTQVSGPNTAVLASAASLTTVVSGLIEGTYTFKLTAKDNNGLSDVSTVTVIVTAASVAPTVSAGGDKEIQLPVNTVTVTGTVTANGGATLDWTTWTEWSGPNTATIGAPGSLQTTISGLVEGVYIFKLSAMDNNGLGTTDQITVTVTAANVPPPPPANKPPVADAGSDRTVQLPVDSIKLDGSGSYDPDGTVAGYNWIQLSGPGGCTITNANTVRPSVYGLNSGAYKFQLTVTDNQGATDAATVTITVTAASTPPPVTNKTPVANAGGDTTIALPNTAALLDGSASTDPSGGVLLYQWKQVSGPATATIAFPNAVTTPVGSLQTGLYVFRLTVTNADGLSDTATVRIRLTNEGRTSPDHSGVQIQAYPNPVQSILHLRFTGDGISGPAQIRIYDMKATLLSAQQVQIGGSGQEATVDMSKMARGVYALQIVMGGANVSYQMVVKQ